jgi:cytochrome c oxidase subunit 2
MFDSFPLWPARASTTAGSVDALFVFLVALSTLMSVAIFTMIVVFAVRYRRRRGVMAEQIEGSTALEVTWSVIPLFIFVAIFVWGAVIYFRERTPPRGATEVYVVAKQWMWKLQHEEGQREINELHVPVGRDVKMIMTSQDVIHSFYVPAFRIKQAAAERRDPWLRTDRICFSSSAAPPVIASIPKAVARIWSACLASRCNWKTGEWLRPTKTTFANPS